MKQMIRSATIRFETTENKKVVVNCPYCGHLHKGKWLKKMYDDCQKCVDHTCGKCKQVFCAVSYYGQCGC